MRDALRSEAAVWALVLALAALAVGVVALAARPAPARISAAPFVRSSQIGAGVADMNRIAQTRVRNALGAYGMSPKRITILSSTVTGSTGTVVLHVDYGPKAGGITSSIDLTIILDRSVWSVEQMNTGLPLAMRKRPRPAHALTG